MPDVTLHIISQIISFFFPEGSQTATAADMNYLTRKQNKQSFIKGNS